jgi:hypothetical protein
MMIMAQQRAEESRWWQSMCEDAQQRVAFEINRRLAAEEHIAATEVQLPLATGDMGAEQREAADEQTVQDEDRVYSTDPTAVVESSWPGRAVPTVPPETMVEHGAGIAVRSYAAILLEGANEQRAVVKQAVEEAVSTCMADADRRVAAEVALRCGAEDRARQAEQLLAVAEESIAALRLNEAKRQEAAKGEATNLVQETVVPPLQAEVGAGQVRKQREVAGIWQCEASVEPPAEDEGRPTKTVEVKTRVEAPFTPTICMRRSVKPAEVNALKRCAIGELVQKCKRCGGYDHTHEVCTSAKPTWGRDWREYRQRRRHRRSVRPSAEKEGKSVAGAKTRTGVGGRLKEVEDSTKQEAAQRRLRQAEQLKEVARVGDALDMEPATGSAEPGS